MLVVWAAGVLGASGTLRGDDHRWLRDGHRAEDSPLKLARRKAQRLASKLQDELLRWARERNLQIPSVRDVVPFVQEAVYLHHPGMRCALSPTARIGLFGVDGSQAGTGLPGIGERLLEPATAQQGVGANRDEIIAALLANIGVVQRRQREVGSWVIDEEPLGEGDGWQDWPAFHRVATTDRHSVRFFVTAPGASTDERNRVRRVADHEYRVMSRLAHDGLLRPRDLVRDCMGGCQHSSRRRALHRAGRRVHGAFLVRLRPVVYGCPVVGAESRPLRL